MFIDRLAKSLQERTRHFSRVAETRRFTRDLGIPKGVFADLETLKVLASCRSYVSERIDLLVDVGAHKAGFALPGYYALGIKQVLAFEPNSRLLPHLNDAFSGICAEVRNLALADQSGTLTLNVHDDPSMSSLLPSDHDVLLREFNTYDLQATQQVQVPVSTLDHQLAEFLIGNKTFFLKLDTQGNELSVLKGSVRSLQCCVGLLTEFMFETPYIGQASFLELINFLDQHQFECKAVLDFRRKPSHRVSSVDFLFLPKPKI
jgi:FkbM family methyltransferase